MEAVQRPGHLQPGAGGLGPGAGGGEGLPGQEHWSLSTYLQVIDEEKADRMAHLQHLGKSNQEEIAEYSLKFYYTNQVDMWMCI